MCAYKNFVGTKRTNSERSTNYRHQKMFCFVVSVKSVNFGYFNEFESFLAHLNENRLIQTHNHTHKFLNGQRHMMFSNRAKKNLILRCRLFFGEDIYIRDNANLIEHALCNLNDSLLEFEPINKILLNQIHQSNNSFNFKIVELFRILRVQLLQLNGKKTIYG